MATYGYSCTQYKQINLSEADEVVLDMAKNTDKGEMFIKYLGHQYGYSLVEAEQIWDSLK